MTATRATKKTISMPAALYRRAIARVKELHYTTFSDYVQELIRRDSLPTKSHNHQPEEQPRENI